MARLTKREVEKYRKKFEKTCKEHELSRHGHNPLEYEDAATQFAWDGYLQACAEMREEIKRSFENATFLAVCTLHIFDQPVIAKDVVIKNGLSLSAMRRAAKAGGSEIDRAAIKWLEREMLGVEE